MKVAIIIPTMNRPDFILRQLRFYELMNSPHPVYLSDSSNPENAEKIKDGIKKFKSLSVTYQWAPPGKDHLCELLPLVKEKYCIQMGDDDIMIPKTTSECADFLENNPDYATCAGKQMNIRFRKEDYNSSLGLVGRQTRPHGRSIEDEDMLVRIKNFWSDPFFVCFVVRRVEVEKEIRNVTKHFPLMDRMLEFLLVSILIISGKSKTLDKLGYVMQVSDNRYGFIHNLAVDVILSSDFGEKWSICKKGFSEIIRRKGVSEEENSKIVKGSFMIYLLRQFTLESDSFFAERFVSEADPLSAGLTSYISAELKPLQRLRRFIANFPFARRIFYRLKYSKSVADNESGYFEDFKIVKDFLEKRGV